MPRKNGSCDFNCFATEARFPPRALPQNNFARCTPPAQRIIDFKMGLKMGLSMPIHTRRNFFLLAAGGLLAAQDRPKNELLVRSVRPEDLEMQLAGFADYLTPNNQFFVRTHVYVPTVTLNQWQLKIDGEVAAPLSL